MLPRSTWLRSPPVPVSYEPAWKPLAEAWAEAFVSMGAAQEQDFLLYARRYSIAHVWAFCALSVVVTPMFWLTDPWTIPEGHTQFFRYRSCMITVGLAGLALQRWVPWLRARPSLLLVLVSTGVVVAGSFTAPALSLERAYVDAGYLFGVFTVGLLIPLAKRVLLSFAISATWLLHLILLLPAGSTNGLASYTVSLVVFTVMGIIMGHAVYLVSRLLYSQSEQLRSFNEALTARVTEQTRDLHRLTEQQATLLEEERIRVARDLHDETGQLVQGMRFELDLHGMQELPHPVGVGLVRMHSLLDRLLDSLRRILRDLRPQLLDDLGLAAALHALIDEFERAPDSPQVARDIEASVGRLEPAKGMALYRIAQEALTNIARHAHASHVRVLLLRAQTGELSLEITDDGVGVSLDAQKRGRVGLVGMRERALVVGGELHITALTPRGTSICVTTPASVLREPS